MKKLLISLVVLGLVSAAPTARSQGAGGAPAGKLRAGVLTADYQFDNTLANSVPGGPPIANLGNNHFYLEAVDGTTRSVLHFNQNDGLVINPAARVMPPDHYTIVILFEFSSVGGYRRVVDFDD